MSTMCSMLRWNSQKPQFQNRLLALCALQSRSLSGRHVSTGFLGPVLGAMMKQVCWHSRRSKADRGLPEARMAELLWKKPPLRTSTCGRHRFRRNHPLCEPRMWQGQVWEARPDGESTRGKAKFGKRHGSRKWEEENSATRRRHRGKGRKRQKTPLPPIQCATHPIGHPQGGLGGLLSITLYFSNAGNASAAIFWWFLASAVVLRTGSPASAEASAGIRACIGRYVNQNGWFSGPCLATLLPRWIEIARACNHSSWFKFSSLQYPLENYKLRNMVRFRAILCLGVPIQCQRLQFYRRPWCQRFYRDFMAPLPCENTSAAWQLFFTARTWAKPHRLDSSVTLLLRRVVQSKTQWHSNVLKLLQKSSQAWKTFFQLLQIKRLQLKLTNTLQNSQSQHQVPRTWAKQHPKTPQTTKTNENPSPSSSMHKLVPFGSKLVLNLVPIGSYGFSSSQIGSYKLKMVSFFSSGVADNALRLGPYMRRSRLK